MGCSQSKATTTTTTTTTAAAAAAHPPHHPPHHDYQKRLSELSMEKSFKVEKCDLAGVKFSWIMDEFIPSCGGIKVLKHMSTKDVLLKFIKPRTKLLLLSYVEYLRHEQRQDVITEKADAFISHWFGYRFLDAVDAIKCHLLRTGGTLDSFIWWDIFCINQHGPKNWSFEWLSTTFKGSIGEIGKVIMIMSPWNQPKPFTRGWCVFEAHSAIATNSQFEIALNSGDEQQFLKDIKRQGIRTIEQMLAEVRAEHSQCSFQEERDKIFQAIETEVGFSKLTSLLFAKYRAWVIETAVEALGNRSTDLGKSAMMLRVGTLHHQQGNYSQAEPLFVEAMEKCKIVLGEDHPCTLTSINNLAHLYDSQGQLEKAEPLYKACLEKRQQVLGEDHPCTLVSINNLASLYDSQGQLEKAEPYYKACLEKMTSVLGDTHPHTLVAVSNLAHLYESLGEYKQAEPLHVDCLSKMKKVLGQEHPHTLVSTSNLAHLYESLGDLEKAEPLHVDCLKKRKKVLGDKHPDTLTSINNLAGLYVRQGNYAKAEPLHVDCWKFMTQVLGDTHPDTLVSINNLAGLYSSQGKYKQAEPLYESCLTKMKQVLGKEHPDTLRAIYNLAGLQFRLEKRVPAVELLQECVLIARRVLGTTHPDTLEYTKSLNVLQTTTTTRTRTTKSTPSG